MKILSHTQNMQWYNVYLFVLFSCQVDSFCSGDQTAYNRSFVVTSWLVDSEVLSICSVKHVNKDLVVQPLSLSLCHPLNVSSSSMHQWRRLAGPFVNRSIIGCIFQWFSWFCAWPIWIFVMDISDWLIQELGNMSWTFWTIFELLFLAECQQVC